MIVGILPNVNSVNLNRYANSVISARLNTGRLKVNPAKDRKKDGDKSAVAILKDAGQLGCVFQDTEPSESLPILRKSPKVLGSIRRVRFTKATQRRAKHLKNSRSAARTNSSQNFSSAVSVRLKKLRLGLRKRLTERSDVPAETCGEWPSISSSSNKKTKLPFSHLPTNGVFQRHP